MPTEPAAPDGAAPLAGVRILDITSVVMGPYATQILGDLGAEVITVEPMTGDINRLMDSGPHPDLSGVALNLLRNKRNVAMDLKHPGALAAVLKIAATCDVFVTNLRPTSLARLHLTYDEVRNVRNDVVYCQAQGYPSDSDNADRPAYDDVIQAETGLADTFRLSTGTPNFVPTIMADKVSVLTIVYAICAALFHRQSTRTSAHIEVPMSSTVTSFMLVEHGASAIPQPALGPVGYPRVLVPNRRPHRTLDGWIAMLPYGTREWEAVLVRAERTDLVDLGLITDRRALMVNANVLYEALSTLLATGTTAEWLAFCHQHSIPAGPVATIDQLVDDLPVAVHPVAGEYKVIPSPVRFDGMTPSVRRPAPLHGEHTVEVLEECGVLPDEIAALEAGAAIR